MLLDLKKRARDFVCLKAGALTRTITIKRIALLPICWNCHGNCSSMSSLTTAKPRKKKGKAVVQDHIRSKVFPLLNKTYKKGNAH